MYAEEIWISPKPERALRFHQPIVDLISNSADNSKYSRFDVVFKISGRTMPRKRDRIPLVNGTLARLPSV